jgi:predicted component of type VI protein secretion system
MNAVEQVLSTEMADLLERLAASVPGGCLPAIGARQPTLKKRLDEMETQLTTAHAALLEGYGRWRRVLEDVENLWAVAAYRLAAEEAIEPAGSIAA